MPPANGSLMNLTHIPQLHSWASHTYLVIITHCAQPHALNPITSHLLPTHPICLCARDNKGWCVVTHYLWPTAVHPTNWLAGAPKVNNSESPLVALSTNKESAKPSTAVETTTDDVTRHSDAIQSVSETRETFQYLWPQFVQLKLNYTYMYVLMDPHPDAGGEFFFLCVSLFIVGQIHSQIFPVQEVQNVNNFHFSSQPLQAYLYLHR